jgi:hypothetical protein
LEATRGALSSVIEDFGDGTGQVTQYDSMGAVLSTEPLTGLPVAETALPDPLLALAQAIVEATSLEDVKPVAQAILDDGIV